MIEIRVLGETLKLHPEKALQWQNHLFLADLHLGKISHFRKMGLPVPEKAETGNLERLIDILGKAETENIHFLGDLFHSHYNSEWESFKQVLSHFPEKKFTLVHGNHDILSSYRYESASIEILPELKMGPFIFSHEPLTQHDRIEEKFNIAGHIHPGALLKGKGKQHITLPCFHFGKDQGILPAFGTFTGLYRVKKSKGDRIFVIVSDKIFEK